ncbi:MAG: tRNA modification GTPase MnmE [Deltaproteobacteria bacterium ADurb.Bin510]|nr:MAG: tRNA modification GTPase MnmE [Deltaproteobacteria bacterium ADurb.Bin510]
MAILVEREHIGIFGKMNAGKSSLMNLITQQATSIVDATPGTTADTREALIELHGLGPVKLFDTAGADEASGLGAKKRAKVLNNLKECDLVILVLNPASRDFAPEAELLEEARVADKQIVVIYNLFELADAALVPGVERQLSLLRFYPRLTVNVSDAAARPQVLDFILSHYEPKNVQLELMPFIEPDEFYILMIPMDDETPPGRYLRPQAMAEEYVTRHWAYPISYRPNLAKARSADKALAAAEQQRFERFLNSLKRRPKAVITDSQAMDVMKTWIPADLALTTFSIMMINYVSRGRLAQFAAGVRELESLKAGDRVLIVEACNHSRIGEDIGTVQIPNYLKQRYPELVIEHNFGREFQENDQLASYRLIVHCGGCMISPQKLSARIRDLEAVGVPYTNYGVFLSYIQGPATLARVLKPWGIEI